MAVKFAKHVSLKGSEKDAPKGKPHAGIDKQDVIKVTVKVVPGTALPNLLDPKVYGRFKPLTREAFAKKYSASTENMDKVTDYAHHTGLSVSKVEHHKATIELCGSVEQMEKAFGITLSNYKDKNGKIYRGRKGAIKIPKELDGIVENISGLDNREVATPKFRMVAGKAGKVTAKKATAQAPYYPTDITKLYNYPKATGKGQCIAIIELGGGYRAVDITNYFKKMKLPVPTVVAVSVDGGHNGPTTPGSADSEVMLDIEVAGGIAPGATIVVYFAKNTNKSFIDAINEAVHDTTYKPSVISISWGSATDSGGYTAATLKAYNAAFQAAAAMGVTVTVAAGDDGSNDSMSDGKAHVDFPAASPYVLACGGTKLLSAKGVITSEVVWNENPPAGGATGGGISEAFAVPAYQAGAKVPVSVNNRKAGRGVPDVAGVADPNTGYEILVDGQYSQVGGTSAVAPMMAGLLALINENNGKSSGFINPKLYANPSVCRDISEGNNITVAGNKGYTAGTGWDACTGLGVADGTKLMGILK